ncbi:hypothetical protein ACYB2S_13875 [Corynebacterium variabile]
MTEYDMGYSDAVADAASIILGIADRNLTALDTQDMAVLTGMIRNLTP